MALFSRINVGVRHILPVYFGFSLLAAGGRRGLHRSGRGRAPGSARRLGMLMVWFAGSSLRCHPDYLAYTNELAGSAPEKVLADSDLDWGQDMKRLSARLRQVGATQVTFDPTIVADFEGELGFPGIVVESRGAVARLERRQPVALESAAPGAARYPPRSGSLAGPRAARRTRGQGRHAVVLSAAHGAAKVT